MLLKGQKKGDDEEWWGWSLPLTRKIIASFDRLAVLLGPEERRWPPSSLQKVAGEIRPRTKTIQHTLRSVMLFRGSEDQMQQIRRLMLILEGKIEPFLVHGTVKMVLNDTEDAGLGTGRGELGSFGGGGATLRRWRAGLHGAIKSWLVDQISELEDKTSKDLVAIENVLRPPRIIKLGGSSAAPVETVSTESWGKRLELIYGGVTVAMWELWDEAVLKIHNLVGWLWHWSS